MFVLGGDDRGGGGGGREEVQPGRYLDGGSAGPPSRQLWRERVEGSLFTFLVFSLPPFRSLRPFVCVPEEHNLTW